MQSRTPFSTDGMKLRGTAPPKMSSTNSKPPPRCIGSTRSHVSPYWPRPPVCFLYLAWPEVAHGLLRLALQPRHVAHALAGPAARVRQRRVRLHGPRHHAEE